MDEFSSTNGLRNFPKICQEGLKVTKDYKTSNISEVTKGQIKLKRPSGVNIFEMTNSDIWKLFKLNKTLTLNWQSINMIFGLKDMSWTRMHFSSRPKYKVGKVQISMKIS